MACPPTNVKFQLRRATSSNWTSTNPVLKGGEPGFEIDTNKLKIGDGITAWQTLPYISGTGGTIGPTGPQGATGLSGTGDGSAGPTGPQGVTGSDGSTGATGPQGTTGTNGATGATGPQGIQGVTGSNGVTGPQGTTGTNGATGATGPQGVTGTNGATGSVSTLTPNTTGVIPLMASASQSGFTITASSEFTPGNFQAWRACDGSNSTDWATQGSSLPIFWQVQCPSSIAIWKFELSQRVGGPEYLVNFTFQGSVDGSSWTTLTSVTGGLASIGLPPNVLPVTVNDPTYTQYSYYRISASSTFGPNPGFAIFQMYSYMNNIQLAIGATGPQGATGSNGTNGSTGPQGIQGVTGPQGTTGTNGSNGATGPQGVSGATGPQGIQGIDGATGPQGIRGVTGSDGATGPQGIQGVTGPQGATGPNGSNGATGPQGVTGVTGPVTSYIFDGGNAQSSYLLGPAFDCGSAI